MYRRPRLIVFPVPQRGTYRHETHPDALFRAARKPPHADGVEQSLARWHPPDAQFCPRRDAGGRPPEYPLPDAQRPRADCPLATSDLASRADLGRADEPEHRRGGRRRLATRRARTAAKRPALRRYPRGGDPDGAGRDGDYHALRSARRHLVGRRAPEQQLPLRPARDRGRGLPHRDGSRGRAQLRPARYPGSEFRGVPVLSGRANDVGRVGRDGHSGAVRRSPGGCLRGHGGQWHLHQRPRSHAAPEQRRFAGHPGQRRRHDRSGHRLLPLHGAAERRQFHGAPADEGSEPACPVRDRLRLQPARGRLGGQHRPAGRRSAGKCSPIQPIGDLLCQGPGRHDRCFRSRRLRAAGPRHPAGERAAGRGQYHGQHRLDGAGQQ